MQWDDSLDLPRRTLAQLSNMHVALYRLANAVQSGTTALPTCKSGDTFDAGDCLYYRNGRKATVSRLVRCVKDGAPVLYAEDEHGTRLPYERMTLEQPDS